MTFSYPGMVARTMLATLDNNFNIAREQATTLHGRKRWKLQWSKVTRSFIVKKLFSKKDYSFREDLIEATIQRLIESKCIKFMLFLCNIIADLLIEIIYSLNKK